MKCLPCKYEGLSREEGGDKRIRGLASQLVQPVNELKIQRWRKTETTSEVKLRPPCAQAHMCAHTTFKVMSEERRVCSLQTKRSKEKFKYQRTNFHIRHKYFSLINYIQNVDIIVQYLIFRDKKLLIFKGTSPFITEYLLYQYIYIIYIFSNYCNKTCSAFDSQVLVSLNLS